MLNMLDAAYVVKILQFFSPKVNRYLQTFLILGGDMDLRLRKRRGRRIVHAAFCQILDVRLRLKSIYEVSVTFGIWHRKGF